MIQTADGTDLSNQPVIETPAADSFFNELQSQSQRHLHTPVDLQGFPANRGRHRGILKSVGDIERIWCMCRWYDLTNHEADAITDEHGTNKPVPAEWPSIHENLSRPASPCEAFPALPSLTE